MKKLLFPIFYPRFTVMVVALILYLFVSGSAKAVELKQNSIVEGSVLTLGDIFYDLPHNEDKVLGPAPRPGSEMVLNARTLLRIATALDLQWRPASAADQIVIERAATLISADDIKAQLIEAVKDNGYNGDFELTLPGTSSEIILPQDQPATFEISELNVDTQSDYYSAVISAPSKANALHTIRVSGKIHQMVRVPVLTDTFRNGNIIRAKDISYQMQRANSIQHDVVLNAEELVGMTPRRIVFNDKPVKVSDIEAPQIIKRGENITMIFKNGSMELTAMGKALENGSKGDLIRVVNNGSSRTITAQVTAEKEVRVQSF